MLPFKLLTGYHLPSAALCALLCAGGFLLSTWIFADFRRRYFPATTGALWLGTVMLGMANLCLMMLTRSDFYEVPIAGAFFFSFAALAGLVLALRNGRSGHWWLVLASLAFGLAVASRPHFILGGGMAGLAWWWRREVRGPGRTPAWRDAAALVIPGALCIGGLLLYNYLRFGSPLNFGQIYQLGGSNQPKMKLVTAESVPVNLYYYLLAPARFGRYFPFVEIVPGYPWAAPQSYYGVEDPFGLLPNLPCYWLLLALPLFWLRRHPARWMTGRCLLLLGALGLPVFGFTLVFVSATNRYMVDFLPSFVLAASIGLLAVASRPLGGVGRVVRACVLSGLVLYSAAFGAMAAFQHNGLFRHHQPAAFDRIGSWFNLPAAAWEHVSHEEFGPAQLTVQFSRESLGAAEPLLVTGSRARADYVYVFHTGPDAIQLGFMHSGDVDGFLSAPIALDYDIPHVIGIQSGSLYPPGSDPKFWGASTAEVEMKKQRLLLTVDGVPYVDLKKSFHDAAPTEVAFGRNPVSEYAGKTFRGKVLQVARRELPPIQGPVDRGSFTRLGLELPH